MIGIHETTDGNGQRLTVRYSRVDNNVRILGISDCAGKDCCVRLKFTEIQRIKSEIPKL